MIYLVNILLFFLFYLFIRKSIGKNFSIYGTIIFLGLFYYYTVITDTLIRYNTMVVLIILLTTFYLAYFFLNYTRIRNHKKNNIYVLNKNSIVLFSSFFMMYAIEFARIIFTNDYSQLNEHIKNLIFIVVVLLAVIQFSYLFNIDNLDKVYKIFLKPYFILCLGISIMAVLNVVLIKIGLINISSWSVPSWLSAGMISRDAVHAHYGGTYKFPLFSTIIYTALSSESLLNYQGIQGIGGQIIGLSFEPHIALEAGVDGFREIKKLIIKSNKLLKKNGKLIFEIGADQKINTEKMLNKYGFYINKVIKDLASIPRIIVSTKLK